MKRLAIQKTEKINLKNARCTKFHHKVWLRNRITLKPFFDAKLLYELRLWTSRGWEVGFGVGAPCLPTCYLQELRLLNFILQDPIIYHTLLESSKKKREIPREQTERNVLTYSQFSVQ